MLEINFAVKNFHLYLLLEFLTFENKKYTLYISLQQIYKLSILLCSRANSCNYIITFHLHGKL